MDVNVIGPIVVMAGLGILIVFSVWMISVAIVDLLKLYSTYKFKKDLICSLSRSDVSWAQVQTLAKCRILKPPQIIKSIEFLISEALTGRDDRLSDQIDTLEYFLDQHKNDAPFEDLPSEVRVQLIKLREVLEDTENAYLLDPLAEHLRKFNNDNIRERIKQKRWSFISIAVGVVGIFVGLIALIDFDKLILKY